MMGRVGGRGKIVSGRVCEELQRRSRRTLSLVLFLACVAFANEVYAQVTFERLVNELLTPRVADAQQRFTFAARLRNGVWDLLYRDVPIQVGARTPEGRLWPA